MGGPPDRPTAGALPRQLDLIGIAAALLDPDQRIVGANQRFAMLLGAGSADLTGQTLDEVVAKSATFTPTTYGVSLICIYHETGLQWYRLDRHPIDGQTLAVLTDVTREHLKIEHLRFTGLVQDQLMEEAQIGVWRYDPDADIYYFATTLSLGYDSRRLAIPASRLAMIQHRDDREKDVEAKQRITTEGGKGEGEMRYRHADQHWVHFRVHYQSGRRLPSGRYEMYGITQDITPQAAARDRANTYLQRLKLALRAARAAVYDYDCRGQRYWISEELASLLDRSELPDCQQPPLELFAEEDREAVETLTRQLMRTGGTASSDVRLLTRNGAIWVRHYVEVQLGSGGRPRRVIGLFLDIAEQKAQELALQEARRAAEAATQAKSDMLSAISHEIRTPLNGVIGMAQSLDGGELSEEQRDKVGIILESGHMLMSLLNDVLDLAKAEAGKMEIVRIAGDLRVVVERTVALFRPNAEEKGVLLAAEFTSDLPARLNFDPVRVRQCLTNLLSNAIKFTPEGGAIRIRVESSRQPDGPQISIRVRDTGIGMSPQTLDKLFSPFGQADGSTSRRFGGTGLGLAISRQLARLMGGDISARSQLDSGSEFCFSFKAGEAEAQPTGTPSPPLPQAPPCGAGDSSTSLAGARVLLVDDNAVNRRVVALFLAPQGALVKEATNGVEALEALRAAPFDIVLLDIHMPVMDGSETLRHIRGSDQTWRDIPVIALTADAMSGDEQRYIAAGMTDYLAKPIERTELIAKMETALQKAGRGETQEGLSRAG